MYRTIFPILLILVFVIGSCSTPADPVSPPGALDPSPFSQAVPTAGHQLFGMWELVFDFERMTAEAAPMRFSEGHFNVRKFMENGPCYQCLTLLNFSPQPDHTFYIDVQFDHPFPGLDNLTGFDVRGIAIFNGSYTFPASGLIMSDSALGDVELLNADGYTNLFNPIDFPPGSDLPILTYTKGKRATVLASPATLNGFKTYFPDAPRRMFRAGESNTQTYHIAWPSGTLLRVGYAVDASWEPPLNKPVVDPATDFGPNANCYEAYKIEVSIGSGLMPGCGYAPYQVDVYDHQGHDTIEAVTLEAPDLISGIIANNSGVDMGGFSRFTGNIPNELEVGEGEYRVLVGAVDKNADPFLGTLTAYTVTTAKVEFAPIEYEHFWRKHGKTLNNNNYNPWETQIDTSLSEVWNHQFPSGVGAVFDSTPTIGSSAVYVVVSIPYAQEIWALDLNSGEQIWHHPIKFQPDNMIYRCTPLVGNCEVYVGGSSVFAFGSEDGDLLWEFEGEDTQYVNGGPVIVDDILVIWGSNDTLYAFEAFTGGFKWDYTAEVFPGNPGTPVVDNGTVYAGDARGYAFALDLITGDEIWKVQFPLGGPVVQNNIWSAPVMADGLIWYGSFNCHLYGLDPTDGSIEVNVPLGDRTPWASPAFDGTHLYQPVAYDPDYWQFFSGPFGVMAITTAGGVDWEFQGTDTEAFWTPPVVANGTVWVPSDAGVIYMLDPSTGSEVLPGGYALDNPVTGGMSIQDGRLYVMDTGGKMYCLE